MANEPVNEEYEAGRAVGYVEGYLEAHAEPPADGYMRIDRSWTCICGVMSGGVRGPRKGCPMHDMGADRG